MDYYEYYIVYSVVGLIIAAGLAFIPANIAKKKGYSFGLWWFYGWMIWIVAIIHVSLIPDKNAPQRPIYVVQPTQNNTPAISSSSAADELKKYKELMDHGVITEEEFQQQKAKILNYSKE